MVDLLFGFVMGVAIIAVIDISLISYIRMANGFLKSGCTSKESGYISGSIVCLVLLLIAAMIYLVSL